MNYKEGIDILKIHLNKWEEESISRFDFKDSIFFDIGAHLGLWSIASLIKGANHVVAFEPNEVYFAGQTISHDNHKVVTRGLIDNLKTLVNVEDRWTCIHTIVSSPEYLDEGSRKMTIDQLSSGTTKETLYHGSSKIPDFPTIMKIDVEGMELAVLKGAENTIRQYKPKLLVETHDFMWPNRKDQVISLLKNWGYGDPEILYMPDPKSFGYHLRYL